MEKQLTLALETPIENLVPALIAWNNAELMEAVRARLADYRGRIYDDAAISEAKADKAQLNNFIKALNSERIRIGKMYDAPYVKFKNEVDEVIKEVNVVVTELDAQVKDYEERRQAQKLEDVRAYYESVVPETLSAFVSYEKIHRKEWLNASKSMTAVKREIDEVLDGIVRDISTIELLGGDSAALKAIYFRSLSLSEAIAENERLTAEKRRISEAEERAKEAAKQEASQEASIEPARESEAPKLFTLAFRVTGTAEQLNALSAYLKANKIQYTRA